MLKSHRTIGMSLVLLLTLFAAAPSLYAKSAKNDHHANQPKVNVNSADAEALALLPRVGPALARRILDFRKKNGPFKKVDDLMLVRGIGERSLELLEPYVALSGKTTLTHKVHVSRAKEGSRP